MRRDNAGGEADLLPPEAHVRRARRRAAHAPGEQVDAADELRDESRVRRAAPVVMAVHERMRRRAAGSRDRVA